MTQLMARPLKFVTRELFSYKKISREDNSNKNNNESANANVDKCTKFFDMILQPILHGVLFLISKSLGASIQASCPSRSLAFHFQFTSYSLPVHFRFTWAAQMVMSHNSIFKKLNFAKFADIHSYMRKEKVTSKDPFRVYTGDLKISNQLIDPREKPHNCVHVCSPLILLSYIQHVLTLADTMPIAQH